MHHYVKEKKEAIDVNFKAIKDCVKILNNKKIIFLMSNSGYGIGKKMNIVMKVLH